MSSLFGLGIKTLEIRSASFAIILLITLRGRKKTGAQCKIAGC